MKETRVSTDLCLALHTSDVPGAVALVGGGEVCARPLASDGKHASTLLGAIDALLAEMRTDIGHVRRIVLTRGPGSFTGIRIGVATAQGLAQAIGVGVSVCDSLWAEAAAHHATGLLAVVLDARRGEVYAGLYRIGAGPPQQLIAPFVATPAVASGRLAAAAATAKLLLSGSGASLLPRDDAASRRFEYLVSGPRPAVAAALALSGAATLSSCAPRDVEPLYLRKSDAELNREARLGAR
jgi:tRNA threonylcarbamoyladenosine biosynthesis protein TsaB